MLIGISGKPGSGKDTMAEMFIEKYGFIRLSLADQIRRVTIEATGLTMSTLRSHRYKDDPLENFNDKTPRQLTIEIGDAIESVLGCDIWTNLLQRKIEDSDSHVVIPDIRTKQQAKWIHDIGGILVRIESVGDASFHPIENQLDDFADWDAWISKDDWFKDKTLIEWIFESY